MSRHTYRGKRVDGQGWAEGDLIHGVGCKDGRIFILPEYSVQSTRNIDGHKVDPATVGQSTGLTYKNGKEIFEGDVVAWQWLHYGPQRTVVSWNDADCGWNISAYLSDAGDGSSTPTTSKVYYTRIGTIHDNPERLEGAGQ